MSLIDAFSVLDSISPQTEQRLEEMYSVSAIWETVEIIKGRPEAPIGTIKRIGDTEYIKTVDGWRYKAKGRKKGQPEEKKDSQLHGELNKPSIREGHQIVAPDGTKGRVISNDGQMAEVEYIKDGEKKTAQVPSTILEQRKQSGSLQHNSAPKTLEDHHTKLASDMLANGKSPSSVVSALKNAGVDEHEAMKHVTEHQDKKNEQKKADENDEDHPDHDKSVEKQADKETNHEGTKTPTTDTETSSTLPNKESEEQGKLLDSKNGPSKLNEKQEGFSVKNTGVLEGGNQKGTDDKATEKSPIDRKFDTFGRYVRGVVNGNMKSMISYGSGGVGKTYTVTSQLEKMGKKPFVVGVHDPGEDSYDYVKITGKMSAAALYKAMYEHNGKLLVFDDCDSVLQDENAINLFKGALDTSGDNTISWGVGSKIKDFNDNVIPQSFKFDGKAIFISNLDVNGDKKLKEALQPIISRGYNIDMTMDAKQTLGRIRSIATKPGSKELTNLKFPGVTYTSQDMEDVLSYLDKNKDQKGIELNVRTVGALLGIKKEAEADGVNWEEDASYTLLRKGEIHDIYSGQMFKDKQQRMLSIFNKGRNFELVKAKFKQYLLNKAESEQDVDFGEVETRGRARLVKLLCRKYREWRDGDTHPDDKYTVFEFLQNNHEDCCGDKGLIDDVLQELKQPERLQKSFDVLLSKANV